MYSWLAHPLASSKDFETILIEKQSIPWKMSENTSRPPLLHVNH